MGTITTVRNNVKGPYEVEVSGPLTHRCPFVDEADVGSITIIYRPAGFILELHALAEYLAEWTDAAIAHEAITTEIASDVGEALDCPFTVVTEWQTAGLDVTVTAARP